MKFISHRRNTIEQLKETNTNYGVEVDIRSFKNKLTIHHDPFIEGEEFDVWIKEYKHNTLILNVKEEGLENLLLESMKKNNINDFFFLDQSFPFLIKTVKNGVAKCAVRISEYESIDTALSLKGMVDWIWVDCFSKFPISSNDFLNLKNANFKICIVSPELQGFDPYTEIPKFKKIFKEKNIVPDAICSKRIDIWESLK